MGDPLRLSADEMVQKSGLQPCVHGQIKGPMKWDGVFCRICEGMFRLTANHARGTVWATGFLVAKYKTPDKLAFALATAEHVFRPLPMYTDVKWTLERFSWKGEATGNVTFTSNLQKMGGSPIRANLEFDVGLVFLPPLAFEPALVRLIHPSFAVEPGAKVGWAGFPAFVSGQLGNPHPCYFEGVISAVVDSTTRDGKLLYLVDGHGGKGVSGGPLWSWDETSGDYQVIGICSKYLLTGDQDPGVIAFEAINPLVRYLESARELEMNIVP